MPRPEHAEDRDQLVRWAEKQGPEGVRAYWAERKQLSLDGHPTGVNERNKGDDMARAIGVGGVFFKSKDPKALGDWYQKWLGVPVEHPYGATFEARTMPSKGFTVWAPFKAETTYFEPSDQAYMFNLIVDDLDGALSQVAEGGAKVMEAREEEEFGRFGWFIDPEGNKVELWEPPEQDSEV